MRRVVTVALLIGVLAGVAAYFVRSARSPTVVCVPAPAAVGKAVIPEPPRDMSAPVLSGVEVRRDALTLREGRRYRPNETVPFTGVMTEFYGNGTLQSRSVLSNGLLEGLSEGWYTNGNKQVEELYRGGISHGLRVKWHENGQKLSEAPIVDGKMDGFFRRWHENGSLAEEVSMRNGNPDGLARSFYPSGCLKAEARLNNGTVVDQKSWADGERPARAGDAVDGRKTPER